jgi:putative nucleotidyltransferase with HDIG domain
VATGLIMTSDERLDELVHLWEDGFRGGVDVPPEELCPEHPELAEALRERIANLKAVAGFLGADSVEGSSLLSPGVEARHGMRDNEWPAPGETCPSDGPSLAELLPARYRLVQEVGAGGMGLVLRVNDTALDRELALKVLPGDDHSELSKRRFRTEARITSQLQHPGIPPVHDIGQLRDGRPFFTMRLVQGFTLADLLRGRADNRENQEVWLWVFAQVCHTVAYAHNQCVIHRDLKPQNIMVGDFGEVQVVDWGLAKLLSKAMKSDEERGAATPTEDTVARFSSTFSRLFRSERWQGSGVESAPNGMGRLGERHGSYEQEDASCTIEGAALGSPAYMPPEQARGEVSRIDERSDVFGLGAILCEILTGNPPFVGTSDEARALARRADLTGAMERLTACGADEELIALARACLEPERDARLPNGAEVARAMQRYRERIHQRLLRSEQERGAAVARVDEEQKRASLLLGAVSLLARTIEERNEHTPGHTYRVSTYAILLATKLGLTTREVELIRVGTLLRDIGKIGMGDAILRKPADQLSKDELTLLNSHTERGAKLLSKVPELRDVEAIVRSHHERWDGEGFPDRLAGGEVPALARVVALADAFDVMTSRRPFGTGLSPEAAFDVIERDAGGWFDPNIAAAFVSIREQILQQMRAFNLVIKQSEQPTEIIKAPKSAQLEADRATSHAAPPASSSQSGESVAELPPMKHDASTAHSPDRSQMKPSIGPRIIRLRGMNGPLKGRLWEATDLLRIGRLEALEIVLDDSSVSRYHAEVRASGRGWRVRDLGSTNGTRLNGERLSNGQWPLRAKDLIQFGEVSVVVEVVVDGEPELDPSQGVGESMRVAGTSKASWNEALEGVAFDSQRCPRAGDQLIALLRAGHHLVHIGREDDLLESILKDAVSVLDAQRGAIVLAEPPDNKLEIRKIASGRAEPRATISACGGFPFSQSLAARCFSRGESILCQKVDEDSELAMAKSIAEGGMASVLCVLLRTAQKTLGVLHLDRSPWQRPFTMDDLYLADALAAHVSIGIDCVRSLGGKTPGGRAFLLSTDLFLDTITGLAQTVEMRDPYTGGHVQRVTTYSTLLAEHLQLAPHELEWIRIGTPLHDIGKIGIDDAILRKPDRLTVEEFEIMKSHTVKGDDILATLPDLRPVSPIVRSHHERWDGKGYPDGLGGEAIPPLAHIVALADAFDAMTSDRPYRKGMPPAVAFAEIEKQSGKQFDPVFAVAFLEIKDAILQEMLCWASKQQATRRLRTVSL